MTTKTKSANTTAIAKQINDGQLYQEFCAFLNGRAPSDGDVRRDILALIKARMKACHHDVEQKLIESHKGMACAQALCFVQDQIIKSIYRFAVEQVFKDDDKAEGERLAIAAIGGYGRGTLAPGSDIDLLFVLPHNQTPWSEAVTEYVLYILWDLGLKVGHAVRSIDDSISMARSDWTICTATLEARFLVGDDNLYEELNKRFKKDIIKGSGPEFIQAKMSERDERHKKMGNTRYLVEPNVKDGKGGLRDLHTLFWIGKYFYQVESAAELVEKKVFSQNEYRAFIKSEDFLWAVRCHLHYLTKRADDRLTFEIQRDLAERLGFKDRGNMLAVERFMKRYFLCTKDVGDLTRIFCTSLEFNHAKKPELLGQVFKKFLPRRKIRGEKDFLIEHGRLQIVHENVFADNPVNLIRIFQVAGKLGILFHPETVKRIARSLKLINNDLRNDPVANKYFLEILCDAPSVERILRRMNESGVLGKFIPEFGKIVALMQFNMYHHYTVDEHLIRSIGVLADIVEGGLADELPLTHEILPQLRETRLLFIALFLHDIAKGRPENHSVAGARVARKLCPRFGLSEAETDTVSWLVAQHLTMSEVAQSRDINDPQTARDFAKIVQSPARLQLLLIMTACDIRAVGPGTWTGWKGALLRGLFYETEPLVSGGHSQLSQTERIARAKENLTTQLMASQPAKNEGLAWTKTRIKKYTERHFNPYWLRAEPDLQVHHAQMIKSAEDKDQRFIGRTRVKKFEGVTELAIFAPDHSRLLSTIAGACTMAESNIVDAQIFTLRDGTVLDDFSLSRTFKNDADEEQRGARIIETVKRILQGETYLPKKLGENSLRNRRIKTFNLPAEVLINNNLSRKFTVIEASGLDRTGLLYALTHAIADLNLSIGSAHITTYGEKAMDVFYVTDLTGMKIESEARQRAIIKRLGDILAPPVKAKVASDKK